MNQGKPERHIRLPYTTLVILWLVLTGFTGTLLGQSASGTQEPSSASDNTVQDGGSETEQSAVRSPLFPVPLFLHNMRNSVGFSLGIYGSYDPKAIVSLSPQKSEALRSAWLNPRLFANVRGKRSQTFFDYNFDARAYSGLGQLNGTSHTATLHFQREISRKVSLGFGEVFNSASNDRRTFLNPIALGAYEQPAAQDFDVISQRVTRNSLSANMSYVMTRRNTVSLFGSYDFWHYTDLDLGNTHGILAGVQSNYRINRWLFLENSYSHYLNTVDNPQRGATSQIHRLQIGGLRFARSLGGRASRGWEASLNGGMDINIPIDGGRPQPAPSLQGGVSRNWEFGQLSLVYRRGFWTAIGPGTVMEGDSVSASFNQSLRRLNLTLGSNYRRGTGSRDSAVDFVSGNVELGFAVQRHLMLSADYWYVSQRVANLLSNVQNVSRYRVEVGINCFLPSLFNR